MTTDNGSLPLSVVKGEVTKNSRLQIFSESSPMPWGPSPSWASFWLSSALCREWRRRWCHSPVIVGSYFHPICAGVGRGPTYQSSKPWSEFHDNGAAKHHLGHPEEHHIQPTLPGGDAYISKIKFVKCTNKTLGKFKSVFQALTKMKIPDKVDKSKSKIQNQLLFHIQIHIQNTNQ